MCTESEVIEELSKSDDDGFTAIHLAARKNSHQVLREIFRCWKEQGYSMDSVLDFIKEENSIPLHVAVDAGNYEVICVLLEFRASASIIKEEMSLPLVLLGDWI